MAADWRKEWALAEKEIESGRLNEAAQRCRRLIAKGDCPPAHYGLAKIFFLQGDIPKAIGEAKILLREHPSFYHANLILSDCQERRGRFDEAFLYHKKACECAPSSAEMWANAARLGVMASRFAEAMEMAEKAIAIKADFGMAHQIRGMLFAQDGRRDEAAESFALAAELDAGCQEALYLLGVTRLEQKRWDDARKVFLQYLDAAPPAQQAALAFQALARVAEGEGDCASALEFYRKAAEIYPSHAPHRYELAHALVDAGQFVDARLVLDKLLVDCPSHAEGWNELGRIALHFGDFARASTCFESAIKARPDWPNAHVNRGIELLRSGNYKEGWDEYNWRWKMEGYPALPFVEKHWGGEDITGKTLLVFGEQGHGDTIQFLRYLPAIKKMAGAARALFHGHESLERLLNFCGGVDGFFSGNEVPQFDYYLPLMSLPWRLGISPFDPSLAPPYVGSFHDESPRSANTTNDENVVQASLPASSDFGGEMPLRKRRLGSPPSVQFSEESKNGVAQRIGLVWAGNPSHKNDKNRSCPVEHFIGFCKRFANVKWVSLQKDVPLDAWNDAGVSIEDGLAGVRDFMDTALRISVLDCVISVDTAVAHLSAAMGKPTWILLPCLADWRWGVTTETSPWYPSATLIRQPQHGDWEAVFDRLLVAYNTKRFA